MKINFVIAGWAVGLGVAGGMADAAELHHCQAVGTRGCAFALELAVERDDLLARVELWARCSENPEETVLLGEAQNVAAAENFRPRYDSRFFGWRQFSLEGLRTGERASILILPSSMGTASLTAHLRLTLPGQPASEALDLTCSF